MKIAYICFEVSNQCNMNCKFCFSLWRTTKSALTTTQAKQTIATLKANGLVAINLTGGDALMRPDIVELCAYCQSIGLYTIISTSGILLPQKQEVLNHIDAINLPLDSFSANIHNSMRPCALPNHHTHVLKQIKFIARHYPKVLIKINTVVTKQNAHEVAQIASLFGGKVNKWKLGKFFASGYGKQFENEFAISKNEFDSVLAKVHQTCPPNLLTSDDYEDLGQDVFVSCNGHLIAVTKSGLKNLGDVSILKSLPDQTEQALWLDYYKQVYQGENNES